jgi:uracil-DNA glycosylase
MGLVFDNSETREWTVEIEDRQAQLEALQAEIRACRLCAAAGYLVGATPIVRGAATARLMLIGQAPGIVEERVHRPFAGPAGKRLFAWLAQAGWSEEEFRARHYISAITRCYPGKGAGGRGDRVPSAAEQALCRPYLERELALLDPAVIVPVGRLAIGRFYDKAARLEEIVGTARRENERWIVPLPHPSGASPWYHQPQNHERLNRALDLLGHLRQDFDL